MEDYLSVAKKIIFGIVEKKIEPICEKCGTILTEEEEHCGSYCFEHYVSMSQDYYDTQEHPDIG